MFLMCSVNSFVLCIWCVWFPTKGLSILANSIATAYMIDPQLETTDLRVCHFVDLGSL